MGTLPNVNIRLPQFPKDTDATRDSLPRRQQETVDADGYVCSACESPVAIALGQLGAWTWVRCRACGLDRSLPADATR